MNAFSAFVFMFVIPFTLMSIKFMLQMGEALYTRVIQGPLVTVTQEKVVYMFLVDYIIRVKDTPLHPDLLITKDVTEMIKSLEQFGLLQNQGKENIGSFTTCDQIYRSTIKVAVPIHVWLFCCVHARG